MFARYLQHSRLALYAVALFSVASTAAAATRVPGPLVDTAWLATQLQNPDVVIIAVRDDPANFDRQHTEKEKADPKAPIVGHIPGARLLDWKLVRETREIDGVKLDKMVPLAKNFEAVMRKLGVRNDQAIIIAVNGKDSSAVTMGTRVYWTLKYFGHTNMALLDGGLKKWQAEARPVAYDNPAIVASQFVAGAVRNELLAQLGLAADRWPYRRLLHRAEHDLGRQGQGPHPGLAHDGAQGSDRRKDRHLPAQERAACACRRCRDQDRR
jgi:thiosulfate/3-mercaptopyruvate sulfurtransferase